MKVTVEAVKARVADDYGVSVADIESQKRTVSLTEPRHVAMCLAYELTGQSSPQVARAFKRRDHTAILYARDKIERRAKLDVNFNHRLGALRNSLVRTATVAAPPVAIASFPNLDHAGFVLR